MLGPINQSYPRSQYDGTAQIWAGSNQTWNLTTVRYGINDVLYDPILANGKEIDGGCNKAIQSAHPKGAFLLYADGSAKFVNLEIFIQVLMNRAGKSERMRDGGF